MRGVNPRDSVAAVRIGLIIATLILGSACEPAGEPARTDSVELVLFTTRCEPEFAPPDRFWVTEGSPWNIGWTTRCRRDDRSFQWQAIKVSFWEDRAEDAWNVWFIEPSVDLVTFGEGSLPGVDALGNDDYPEALLRVRPVDPLPSGDYRVEVWGVQEDLADAQTSEVRVTVLP